MVKKYLSVLLVLFCLLFALTACGSQSTNTSQSSMPSGASGTMPAGQAPAQPGATEVATEAATEAPTATATITSTPAPTATATAVTMESTAIISIYCQNGPSEDYASVYIMKKGSQMLTLGRTAASDYYLVQFEDGTNHQCWAWKNYLTIDGNSYDLPVVTVEAAAN